MNQIKKGGVETFNNKNNSVSNFLEGVKNKGKVIYDFLDKRDSLNDLDFKLTFEKYKLYF